MGAIEIEHVSFTYDDITSSAAGVEPEQALRDVSISIPDGQFLCLIGHSGCGKTTLLRLLAGLDEPTEGRIVIDGKQIDGPGLDRAIVFQNYSLFPWMRVARNVEFGIEQAAKELGRRQNKKEIAYRARVYLDKVGMAHAAEKYPYQLSGGMRQRVAIARALAMDTEILLCDEPFGALDVKTRCSLQKLIDQLWRSGEKRKTVFFITHDIDEALLLADRIVFMRHGSVLEDRMVDLPRTRSSSLLIDDPIAQELKKDLTELFYLDPESHEDDEAHI